MEIGPYSCQDDELHNNYRVKIITSFIKFAKMIKTNQNPMHK
jgi:hypothetical protein